MQSGYYWLRNTFTDREVFNLAMAVQAMKEYIDIQQSYSLFQTREELELEDQLKKLIERINVIEHIQRGWLSVGHLSTYHMIRESKDKIDREKEELGNIEKLESEAFDQSKLLEESKKAHVNMLRFTEGQVQALLHTTKILRQNLLDKSGNEQQKYTNLFNRLEKCFNKVLKNIDEVNTSGLSGQIIKRINLSDDPDAFFSDQGQLVVYAGQLNGIYYPLSQHLDPLKCDRELNGKEGPKGMCFGFIMAYCKEVAEKGRFVKHPVSDSQITFEQEHQVSFNRLMKSTSSFEFIDRITQYKAITEALNMISPDSVYSIHLYGSNLGHVVGIRMLPNGHVEFYDPNLGIFVFPKMDYFRYWFIRVFDELYHVHFTSQAGANEVGGLRVTRQCDQPSHAVSSIPLKESTKENQIDPLLAVYGNFLEMCHLHPIMTRTQLRYLYHNFQTISQLMLEKSDFSFGSGDLLCLRQLINNNFLLTCFDIKFQGEFLDQIAETKKLKSHVDLELSKLLYLYGKNKDVEKALLELREQINKAQPGLTLLSVITKWEQENQGIKNLLNKNANIYKSIQSILKDNEINPVVLEVMQMEFIMNLVNFKELVEELEPDSELLKEINRILKLMKAQFKAGKLVGDVINHVTNELNKRQADTLFIQRKEEPSMQHYLISILRAVNASSMKSIEDANIGLREISISFTETVELQEAEELSDEEDNEEKEKLQPK